jgi:scyllo-inositol 2-dehydrogenase (NADP+)
VSCETRWVVVGYGMGAYHARLIQEVEGLTLHGVCDIEAAKRERAARDYPQTKTYSDFEKVLADEAVDGVVIVTPHNVHAEMAIAALKAGKHAITDKAMCLSVAEAKAMIAARDQSGKLLSTFHNRRWDSEFLTVQRLVEQGTLGRLYHIESCVTSYGQTGGWRADRRQMGGWLYDWGAHTLDQILLLAKARPRQVYAFAHHRYDNPAAVEDYVHCAIVFENGLTAVTVIGYLNRIQVPRWYILGEHATLQADDFDRPVCVRGKIGGVEGELSVPLLKGDWKSYYQNIADSLAGRAQLIVKPEQLVPQIAVAEAAYRSIQTQQAVKVELP